MKDRTVSLNELQTEDLFKAKPLPEQQVLAYLKKHRRATQSIISRECNISGATAYKHLSRFVKLGLLNDLGLHKIKKNVVRIYELK